VYVELRVLLNPGMVGCRVVGHKVEQQTHASIVDSLAKTAQGSIPSEVRVYGVTLNCKARATDVRIVEIRKQRLKLAAPLGICQRDPSSSGPSLPDAKKPNPIETRVRQPVQHRVWDVIQCGWAA
jgi:hypothetical protein